MAYWIAVLIGPMLVSLAAAIAIVALARMAARVWPGLSGGRVGEISFAWMVCSAVFAVATFAMAHAAVAADALRNYQTGPLEGTDLLRSWSAISVLIWALLASYRSRTRFT